MTTTRRRIRVSPVLAWYDLWVGMYWDASKRRLYVLPIPCVGVCIHFDEGNHG